MPRRRNRPVPPPYSSRGAGAEIARGPRTLTLAPPAAEAEPSFGRPKSFGTTI